MGNCFSNRESSSKTATPPKGRTTNNYVDGGGGGLNTGLASLPPRSGTPPPTPPFPDPNARVVVGLYQYDGRTDGDLDFKKGKLLLYKC